MFIKFRSVLAGRIGKNSIYSVVDQFLSLLLNFFLSVLLARYLGAVSLGQYALSLAVVGIISIPTNFGVVPVFSKKIAGNPRKTNICLGNALGIKLFLSFPLLLTFTYLSVHLLNITQETASVVILMSIYIHFLSAVTYVGAALTSLHRNDLLVKINFFYKSSSFVGSFILLDNGFSIKEVLYLFIAFSLFSFFISLFCIKKIVPSFKIVFNRKYVKVYILTSLPLVLAGMGEFSNLKIDSVFIGSILDEEAVGIYSSAFNIVLGAVLIALALIKVYFPNFTDFYSKDKAKAISLFKNYNNLLMIFSFSITVFIVIFSDRIIYIVYGNDFEGAVIVLKFLSVSLIVMLLNRLYNYTLIALGEYKFYSTITLCGTIVNLALNYLLILTMGLIGVAIATVLTELIVMILGYRKVSERLAI